MTCKPISEEECKEVVAFVKLHGRLPGKYEPIHLKRYVNILKKQLSKGSLNTDIELLIQNKTTILLLGSSEDKQLAYYNELIDFRMNNPTSWPKTGSVNKKEYKSELSVNWFIPYS